MSIQLIVYPQSYNGTHNAISSSPTEFIVNGINFNDVDNSLTYTSSSASPYTDTLVNKTPSVINSWYRFRTNTAGTPAYPSVVAGNIVLNSVAGTGSLSGIYQRLSNLTAGVQYTITINFSAANTGFIITQYANGTTIYDGGVGSIATPFTDTFTAQSTSDTIMVAYSDTIDNDTTITSISIQPVIGAIPSGSIIIDDGQAICDLYEDEDLPLTLSVDDFKNVAEKVQSYSKAFNLPSTKRNNRIFNAIFEVTRSDDGLIFNPYKRTQCVLKQDGFILFEGYLRMLDITDKEGEISYNVNLYSEVVALADTLKDRSFRDLDFTELEHDYNRTQIKNSWNDGTTGITYTNPSTSGFRDAYSTVKYPFVDWDHQIIVADNPGAASGPTDGNPEFTALEQMFRPFISIKYLIDRIFEASEFTYESAFFNTTDFGKLYMDFNWGADNAPVVFDSSGELTNAGDFGLGTTYITLPFDEMDFPLVGGTALDANFGYSAGVFTAQEDGQVYTFTYNMDFDRSVVPDTLEVEWLVNGVSVNYATTSFSSFTYAGSFTTPPLSAGDTVLCQAKSSLGLYDLDGVLNIFGTTPSLVTITTSVAQTTTDTLLGTLRGELGQWDFLKGLMTMFNLVTLVDEDNPNNIIIEPYTNIFIPDATAGTTLANRGIEHDWTDKIDVSEMKLTPLTDLNKKTLFKFVEDEDDYAFNQYKNQVGGHLYGSKKFPLVPDDRFNILDGEEEIVAEPFAATVVKPLMGQFPQFITPAIYSYNADDGTSEGFENSPRIMYNNGIKDSGTTYYIPEQNGVTSSNEPNFLQFSHLSDIPTLTGTRDFHFGECQLLTGVGVATPNNLFNTYWLPYYSELYNPDTRIMTIKVNLSPSDINTFKFNDRVFIKNRVFRVNKIDYKPNDLATVEFILIP